MAESRRPRRGLSAFLTGQSGDDSTDEPPVPEATAPARPPSATNAPLIPDDAPRRPATRVVRSASAAPPTEPPVAVGPDGEEVPIIALPDYAAPAGVVVSAGHDADGVEYVFEDDPTADPLVDPRYDAQDRNWVRYRTSWGGMFRIVGFIALVVLLVMVARNRIYDWVDDQIAAGGDHGEPVAFTIPDGVAVNTVATELATAGVIDNATVFRYWLRCDGPNGGEITITGFLGCDTEVQFQAGDYELVENMTYEEVVVALEEGPIEEVISTVLVPEGLRISQLIEQLLDENDLFDRQELQEALSNQELTSQYLRPESAVFWPFEGMLFPAVYDIPEQDLANEAQLIARMSVEFDDRFGGLLEQGGLPPMAEELGLDEYDMIVIASLIEEEARVDEDRAKISRVIWNRLLQGWPLGIDASACYAPAIPCSDLTIAEIEDPNPWNTRVVTGLPPTPISAPGEAALEAALNPADGDWMYYVLTNEGGVEGAHRFVVTEGEFEEAKAECIRLDLGCG